MWHENMTIGNIMSEYCIVLSYYDIKIEDVTAESHDMAFLCQDIRL